MDEAPTTSTRAVEKVITVVAASPVSWEHAAQVIVSDAAKTIRDLHVAHVIERDVLLADGAIAMYRIKLRLAFRIDRRRPSLTPGESDIEVKRWLIVTNQTLGTGEVVAEVERLSAEGPCEFHLLVPATLSQSYARARRMSMMAADPVTGIPSELLQAGSDLLGPDTEGQEKAGKRLAAQVEKLRNSSYDVTAELGDPDPIRAIVSVLTRASFDGIILSTQPAGISRFVKGDLPSRVKRVSDLPVTYLPGQVPDDDEL